MALVNSPPVQDSKESEAKASPLEKFGEPLCRFGWLGSSLAGGW